MHLDSLPHAPSVGLQYVPGQSLADHIGYYAEGEDVDGFSDLDERIACESLN